MYVFIGENFWCFVLDTYIHHNMFLIYMSSFRPRRITTVILHRMHGQNCTSEQMHVTFGGLLLKTGEQAAWKMV